MGIGATKMYYIIIFVCLFVFRESGRGELSITIVLLLMNLEDLDLRVIGTPKCKGVGCRKQHIHNVLAMFLTFYYQV